MLRALRCQEPDHLPCSFMLFGALKSRCRTYAEFIDEQVAMGLDAVVELPPRPPVVVNDWHNLHGLPVSYDPRVVVREQKVRLPDEERPVLVNHHLETTLRIPVSRRMLVGGMTFQVPGRQSEHSLYLFVKLAMQELRDDQSLADQPVKPTIKSAPAHKPEPASKR